MDITEDNKLRSNTLPVGLNVLSSSNNSQLTNDGIMFNKSATINNITPMFASNKGGDLTNLIGVGLIGALNTNGYSNTSILASNLFASGSSTDESNFNKRLLSRYGSYLIISLINPSEFTNDIVKKSFS
jgi:hypothetical protein